MSPVLGDIDAKDIRQPRHREDVRTWIVQCRNVGWREERQVHCSVSDREFTGVGSRYMDTSRAVIGHLLTEFMHHASGTTQLAHEPTWHVWVVGPRAVVVSRMYQITGICDRRTRNDERRKDRPGQCPKHRSF